MNIRIENSWLLALSGECITSIGVYSYGKPNFDRWTYLFVANHIDIDWICCTEVGAKGDDIYKSQKKTTIGGWSGVHSIGLCWAEYG